MKELDDDPGRGSAVHSPHGPCPDCIKVDIDEYVDAWCMDPAMMRYFRLSRERGIEIVDVPEQYL